jgi:hypothetical protein
MGKVIDFLARAGGDAALRYASADVVRKASVEAGVDDAAVRDALSSNDGDALRASLGLSEFYGTQQPVGPAREDEDPLDGEDEDGDGEPDGAISRASSSEFSC